MSDRPRLSFLQIACLVGLLAVGLPAGLYAVLVLNPPYAKINEALQLRDRLLVSIVKRFAAEGITMAYPAQTTFTASPAGKLIMPYPEVQPVTHVDVGTDEKPAAKT